MITKSYCFRSESTELLQLGRRLSVTTRTLLTGIFTYCACDFGNRWMEATGLIMNADRLNGIERRVNNGCGCGDIEWCLAKCSSKQRKQYTRLARVKRAEPRGNVYQQRDIASYFSIRIPHEQSTSLTESTQIYSCKSRYIDEGHYCTVNIMKCCTKLKRQNI